jgi:hypothetical protein
MRACPQDSFKNSSAKAQYFCKSKKQKKNFGRDCAQEKTAKILSKRERGLATAQLPL